MTNIQTPTVLNPALIIPVDPAIENYMYGLLNHTDHPVLIDMEALAKENNFPIVDRLVGVFLETLTKMINAKHVFEFGSGYGYSAYWFARAVGSDGQVICSDGDPLNKVKAEQYLSSAALWDNIDFHVGIAQEIFMQTSGMFDSFINPTRDGVVVARRKTV